MATVIKRSNEIGDPRLLREPFLEPGVQPVHRLSALNFQGVDGSGASAVPDTGNTEQIFRNGPGGVATYRVTTSGVPVYDVNMAATPSSETLYKGTVSPPKTQLFVGRVISLGDNNGYTPLIRAEASGYQSITIGNSQHSATAGRVSAFSPYANGTALSILGPAIEVGPNSSLHFFAAVWDGANSRLHYDRTVTTGTLTDPNGPYMEVGYYPLGGRIQCVEAAHYATPLSAAEIEEKRLHYEGVYQFRN